MEIKQINPSRPDSYERLAHDSGVARFLLDLRQGNHESLRYRLLEPKLKRFIGVIYRPETERWSHYSACSLPQQFDAYVWFDKTAAVTTADPATRRGRRDLSLRPLKRAVRPALLGPPRADGRKLARTSKPEFPRGHDRDGLNSLPNVWSRPLRRYRMAASPDASQAAPLGHQGRSHDQAESDQDQHGACGVSVFPALAQRLPVGRRAQPVVGTFVGRKDPDEGYRQGRGHAQTPGHTEQPWRALIAQEDSKIGIRDQGGDQDDSCEVPATIDLLDDEVGFLRQPDLVGQRQQMRAAGHKRDGRQHDREKLGDIQWRVPRFELVSDGPTTAVFAASETSARTIRPIIAERVSRAT